VGGGVVIVLVLLVAVFVYCVVVWTWWLVEDTRPSPIPRGEIFEDRVP
jgi:hypothetical protein